MRLDRIREQEDCRQLLQGIDRQGLLNAGSDHNQIATADEEALLAELGIAISARPNDIQSLRHVRSNAEKQAAEEIGSRTVCKDFESFKPIFQRVQKDLEGLGTQEIKDFEKT